jgi:hypothetical protein
MFGSPLAFSPLAVRVQVPPRGVPPLYAWRTQLRIAFSPHQFGCRDSWMKYGPNTVDSVRICAIHSLLSTAPALCQVASPFSSSRPTVFSQSRRPFIVAWSSMIFTFVRPVCAAPFFTALLIVGSAVLLAQFASLFQKPQPPVFIRV